MTDKKSPAEAYKHEPWNISVEQNLLGALLYENAHIDSAAAELTDEAFYDPLHARLFQSIIELAATGRVTPLILHAYMKADPGMIEVGGQPYLDAMRAAAPALPNVKDYCAILRDLHGRRQMIRIGEDMVADAHEPPSAFPVEKAIGEATDRLLALTGSYRQDRTQALSAVTASRLELAEKRLSGEIVPRLSTGLDRLDKAMGGLQPGDHLILAGRSGGGKEQPIDTPTLTPSGWRPIGELKTGDLVIGANGKPTKVLAVWPQGVKQAYAVTFRDKTSVECGLEHLWTLIHTGGRNIRKRFTVPLKWMMERGPLEPTGGHVKHKAKWKIPVSEAVEWPAVGFPVDPYVLGVLLGDGSISGRDFRYSNPDMDSDIRQRVRDRLPEDVNTRENRQGACPYFDLTGVGASRIKRAFAALNLRVLSGEKFVPEHLLFSSIEQRRDILRGLMDTDGSCCKNRTTFHSTSPRLQSAVCFLVRSLGGVAIPRQYDRSHQEKPTEFEVNVKVDFCPFYTSRKAANWKPTPPAKAVFGIEPTRMVEQVCITVAAEDGLYLTKDFIVTHNTALLCALGQAVALQGAPVMAISADMTKERWGERTLTGVDFMLRHGAYPIRYGHFRGKMGVEAISRLAEAQQIIQGWAYDICDEGEITVSRIRAKVRAMANRHKGKQGVLLTDFLQKIQADTKGKDRRRDEDITAVTYAIGDIAKDVGWTAISLAQLKNKDTDAKGKMREDPPTETDIRESGGILMAADSVIAIHRKAFFVERREPPGRDFSPEPPADWKEWNAELNVVRNDLDLIGFKNRDDSISRLNMRLWCDMGSNAILDARPRDWPKPAGAGDDPGLGLTP